MNNIEMAEVEYSFEEKWLVAGKHTHLKGDDRFQITLS